MSPPTISRSFFVSEGSFQKVQSVRPRKNLLDLSPGVDRHAGEARGLLLSDLLFTKTFFFTHDLDMLLRKKTSPQFSIYHEREGRERRPPAFP